MHSNSLLESKPRKSPHYCSRRICPRAAERKKQKKKKIKTFLSDFYFLFLFSLTRSGAYPHRPPAPRGRGGRRQRLFRLLNWDWPADGAPRDFEPEGVRREGGACAGA